MLTSLRKVLFGKNSTGVRCLNYGALGLFMACLLYSACMPENINLPYTYRLRSVTTKNATKVTASGATLAGSVSVIGSEGILCGVMYGTTSILNSNTSTKKFTTSSGDFNVNISGLKANTTFYYRAFAVDDDAYRYGSILSFKTTPNLSVTTGNAANITDSGVTLYGTVNGADKSLTCGIIYGTSSTLSSSNGSMKSTSSAGSYSIILSGLNANTTYYYRAFVKENENYKYGEISSFKTTVSSVSVTTGSATNITSCSATLGGSIDGADQSLDCGIIYGTSSTLSSTNGTKKSTTSNSDFSLSVTGLKAQTTYYYRAYVIVGGEYRYGDVRSFTTEQETSNVSVTTGEVYDITEDGATLMGEVIGSTQSLTCGIVYGISPTLSSPIWKSTTSNGHFSIQVTELSSNTTYYYRAYVIVDGEYRFGDVRSFTTEQEFINVSVSTRYATNVTAHEATLNGRIDGASQSLPCGIIYGTSSSLSPTNGIMKTTTSNGNFSIQATELNPSTTYYYCAYVIVQNEYLYGDVCSFMTKEDEKDSHKAVDLGLSVKWATCNVGASSPEEYGGYYAWGEITEKEEYTAESYQYRKANGEYIDIGDNISGNEKYDAARALWGDKWRMPIRNEFVELSEACKFLWTTVNGVKGIKVTGPNGNSIFLPATGYGNGTDVNSRGSSGNYWSGTISQDYSYRAELFGFDDDLGWSIAIAYRMGGCTIRPVTE